MRDLAAHGAKPDVVVRKELHTLAADSKHEYVGVDALPVLKVRPNRAALKRLKAGKFAV